MCSPRSPRYKIIDIASILKNLQNIQFQCFHTSSTYTSPIKCSRTKLITNRINNISIYYAIVEFHRHILTNANPLWIPKCVGSKVEVVQGSQSSDDRRSANSSFSAPCAPQPARARCPAIAVGLEAYHSYLTRLSKARQWQARSPCFGKLEERRRTVRNFKRGQRESEI